jgi:hypothetical protein
MLAFINVPGTRAPRNAYDWGAPGRQVRDHLTFGPAGLPRRCSTNSPQMPSRQERRKAERAAAKRAPAKAGAAGAGGAAATGENVNPVGDWTTQAEDPLVLFRAIGSETLKQRASAGDREAQFSLGFMLMRAADGNSGPLGVSGRSPKADVGLVLCTLLARQPQEAWVRS